MTVWQVVTTEIHKRICDQFINIYSQHPHIQYVCKTSLWIRSLHLTFDKISVAFNFGTEWPWRERVKWHACVVQCTIVALAFLQATSSPVLQNTARLSEIRTYQTERETQFFSRTWCNSITFQAIFYLQCCKQISATKSCVNDNWLL